MLRHSDKYHASQPLHHVLVLRIVADMVYNYYSKIVESGHWRYTSFVLRQDIDANSFVITNTIVFGANIFLTEKSKLMQIHTSTCQKAGRFFVNAQNTINSVREIGSQKGLNSCTHALIYIRSQLSRSLSSVLFDSLIMLVFFVRTCVLVLSAG